MQVIINKYYLQRWHYSKISNNPNITFDIVRNNPDEKWNWTQLSYNRMEKTLLKYINNNIKIIYENIKKYTNEDIAYIIIQNLIQEQS